VLEPADTETYAVNLDSSRQKFEREALAAAALAYNTQAYESQIDLDGEHWYRLRLGLLQRTRRRSVCSRRTRQVSARLDRGQ